MNRRTVLADRIRFGWCSAPPGIRPDHRSCSKSYVAKFESAGVKAGDTVHCECECHGPDVPRRSREETDEASQDGVSAEDSDQPMDPSDTEGAPSEAPERTAS